jgi:ribonuclease P protein component
LLLVTWTGAPGRAASARRLAFAVETMSEAHRERIAPAQRLRTSIEYGHVKRDGTARRGRHCLLLALLRPGDPTKVGFIASKKGVGGAVQRNRARRRLREIVRRRWPRIEPMGHWLVFIANRSALTAPHVDLAAEVEHLLEESGALGARGR